MIRPFDLPSRETIARFSTRQPAPVTFHYRKYSAEEKAKVIEFMRQGHGPCEAAERFGLLRGTVTKWGQKAGLKFKRGYQARRNIA